MRLRIPTSPRKNSIPPKTLPITRYTNPLADDSFILPQELICDTILVSQLAANVIAMSTCDTTMLVFIFF